MGALRRVLVCSLIGFSCFYGAKAEDSLIELRRDNIYNTSLEGFVEARDTKERQEALFSGVLFVDFRGKSFVGDEETFLELVVDKFGSFVCEDDLETRFRFVEVLESKEDELAAEKVTEELVSKNCSGAVWGSLVDKYRAFYDVDRLARKVKKAITIRPTGTTAIGVYPENLDFGQDNIVLYLDQKGERLFGRVKLNSDRGRVGVGFRYFFQGELYLETSRYFAEGESKFNDKTFSVIYGRKL